MILTCEGCKTRYLVDAEDIGVGGRDVRCAVCGMEWFVAYQPDEIEPSAPAAAPVEERDDPVPLSPDEAGIELPDDDDEDLRLPVIASARVDYEHQLPMVRPNQEPGIGGLILLIAVLMTFAAIAFLIVGRDRIVSFWPPAAHAYALFNMDVAVDGMVLRDVQTERFAVDDSRSDVVLTGVYINTSPYTKYVPPLKVTVRDKSGAVLYFSVFKSAQLTLAPSKSARFRHVLKDPPPHAHSLDVNFTASRPDE